jgi:hypothetical protein
MKHYKWFCEPAVCSTNPTKWGCNWTQGYVEPNTQTQVVDQCNSTDLCVMTRDQRIPQ